MRPFNACASAIPPMDRILAAALPEGGATSSRLIGDPPEDAMVGVSAGQFPGLLPWRNIFSCPRRRGLCRWLIFAVCRRRRPIRCSAGCGARTPKALRSAPIAAAQSSIPIGVAACSNARHAIGSFRRPAGPCSFAESFRFDPAFGLQSVRQRRQGHQQSSVGPQSGAACENRVRITSQAAMRFDIELRDDDFERGR